MAIRQPPLRSRNAAAVAGVKKNHSIAFPDFRVLYQVSLEVRYDPMAGGSFIGEKDDMGRRDMKDFRQKSINILAVVLAA